MFVGGYFPASFFPPGWFPKTGATQAGGRGFKGAGQIVALLLAEAKWRRKRRQEYAARQIEEMLASADQKKLEWAAESWHANRINNAAAFSVLLSEL